MRTELLERDLNPRPPDKRSIALPTELPSLPSTLDICITYIDILSITDNTPGHTLYSTYRALGCTVVGDCLLHLTEPTFHPGIQYSVASFNAR